MTNPKETQFDRVQARVDLIIGRTPTEWDAAVNSLRPLLERVFKEGYEQGWDDRGQVQSGHLNQVNATNPFAKPNGRKTLT